MTNFNPYIDKIDMDFWRELCVKEGKLCHYKKGEYFLRRGETTKSVWGFIQKGYFKYSVADSDENMHITGFARNSQTTLSIVPFYTRNFTAEI